MSLLKIAMPTWLLSLPIAALVSAESEPAPLPGRTIEMEITKEGFVPSEIKVKKGEQLNLVITRKIDKTCATEIVIDEYAINKKLPLNTPVTVSFVPQKPGKLKYGCAMGKMIRGVIFIE